MKFVYTKPKLHYLNNVSAVCTTGSSATNALSCSVGTGDTGGGCTPGSVAMGVGGNPACNSGSIAFDSGGVIPACVGNGTTAMGTQGLGDCSGTGGSASNTSCGVGNSASTM